MAEKTETEILKEIIVFLNVEIYNYKIKLKRSNDDYNRVVKKLQEEKKI